MKTLLLLSFLLTLSLLPALAADAINLFDGTSLEAWEFAEGA